MKRGYLLRSLNEPLGWWKIKSKSAWSTMETCRFEVHKLAFVGLTAMKRWLGIPSHSTVNWWNISLAWNLTISSTSHTLFSAEHLPCSKVTPPFSLLLISFFDAPPVISYFSVDMATATATVLFLLGQKKRSVLFQQLFMLASVHPVYMNTWAVFVSLGLY